MTLLQLESNRINAHFNKMWQAWQHEHHISHDLSFNRVIWRQFPLALYDLFPDISFQNARHISLASRAASLYTLLQQTNGSGWTPAQLQQAYDWLHHFTLEQLAMAIPATSPFWTTFHDSYKICREAFQEELDYLTIPAKTYAQDRFIVITKNQTILAQLITQAFATLAIENEHLDDILASQSYFYVGLRLYEHVLSWKEDFASGTFSYPLINLIAKRVVLKPATTAIERQEQLTQVGQYFYYTGMAEETLEEASHNFYRAMAIVTELGSTFWGITIGHFVEQSEKLRKDINLIRYKQVTQMIVSPQTLVRKDDAIEVHDQLSQAIDNGINYLIQEQQSNGSWGDFMLRGEQSTAWVTGYVGWILQQVAPKHPCLEMAASWLTATQLPDGWGYNRNWPEDIDAIANVLLFLSNNKQIDSKQWQSLLDMIISLQAKDGGFSTVIDAEAWLVRFRFPVTGFRGWSSSHPCVTALVALLLVTLNDKKYWSHTLKVRDYLRAQQQEDGYWHAYWWAGNYYTTCRAVQALQMIGDPSDQVALAKATHWLLQSQLTDGSWSLAGEPPGQPFHTAFAVQSLASVTSNEEQQAAWFAGVKWLLANQRPDGSWNSEPVLRVPDPDMLCPWTFEKWRDSIFGLNVVVPDWHRLFTTATVVQALHTTLFAAGSDDHHLALAVNTAHSQGGGRLVGDARSLRYFAGA